jgi:hypothetical protein
MTYNRPLTIDDLTRITEPESTAPGYLAWKKAKVAATIKHMDEHPDDFSTLDEVWRHFGLEG